MNDSDWNANAKLVHSELKRINERLDKFDDDMATIRVQTAILKVKAGVWGLLGGLLPAMAALLWFIVNRLSEK